MSQILSFSPLIAFSELLRCLEKGTKNLKEYLKMYTVIMSLLVKRRQKWEFLTGKEGGPLLNTHRPLAEISKS